MRLIALAVVVALGGTLAVPTAVVAKQPVSSHHSKGGHGNNNGNNNVGNHNGNNNSANNRGNGNHGNNKGNGGHKNNGNHYGHDKGHGPVKQPLHNHPAVPVTVKNQLNHLGLPNVGKPFK